MKKSSLMYETDLIAQVAKVHKQLGRLLKVCHSKEMYRTKCCYMPVIVFNLVKKVYRFIGLNLCLYFIFVH